MEEQSKKLTKSKKRRIKRKEKYISLKNIENQNRQAIINSLIKHNENEGQLTLNLQSMKYLNQKRNNKNKKNKVKYKKNIISESENSISDEENNSSSSNEKKTQEITKEQKLKNQNTIIEEIKKQRKEEEKKEEYEELKDIIIDDIPIYKPSEKSLILINRKKEIIEFRKNLPIIKQEDDIMYAINNCLVTIISGETGSGKSTQIPQFLYEKGYTNEIGNIIITQPRRVAARTLSMRLANELNVTLGNEVGYQIRFESYNFSNETKIKFVTDGILLKEIENDQLLSKYSVVIIDEAHERTVNSDLLIGFISQIIKLRYSLWRNGKKYFNQDKFVYPLRLVIMSATMSVSDFSENQIFLPYIKPKVVEIFSRQYKVNVFHSKHTLPDYLNEAFKLCVKIHKKLPEGNVLVFLTGKREILELCKKLNEEFSKNYFEENNENENIQNSKNETSNNNIKLEEEIMNDNENNIKEKEKENIENSKKEISNNKIKLEEEIMNDNENNIKENENIENLNKKEKSYNPVIILPLYSSMSVEDQMKIFTEHKGKRMFVISTNIAETSLTIPSIKYVIDSGKVKKRIYKSGLSFSTFEIEWISQSSANQRMGRAGRTMEGYCYRLYSTGLLNKMEKFTQPQICSSPLSQIILTLKSMNVKNIHKFPFLTKPNNFFLYKGIEHLIVLDALKCNDNENEVRINKILNLLKLNKENDDNELNDSTIITDIGRLMSKFPIEPKFSKLLIMSKGFNLIEYFIIIVSFLAIENPFDFSSMKLSYKEYIDELKNLHIYHSNSDIICYLNLLILLYKNKTSKIIINERKYEEIKNLVNQLYSICQNIFKNKLRKINELSLPNKEQQNLIMQILLCGFIDNLARKKILYDDVGNTINEKNTQILKKKTIYECNENNIECKLHYFSVLNENFPELILYKEIISENGKSYLQFLSTINKEWLYNIGGSLIKSSLSISFKEPYYNKYTDSLYCFVNITYGYKNWDIPNVAVEMNKNDINYFRYFSRLLLEGEILTEMKQYKMKLNSNPNIITNKFSDMYTKVNRLISILKDHNITSKELLINKLKVDNKFLKEIILMWYDDLKIKNNIKLNWPFLK